MPGLIKFSFLYRIGLMTGIYSVCMNVLGALAAGIAAGTTFSLSMMFFALRTNMPGESADLSGVVQSVGYLIAATGPIVLGLVADVVESWNAPLNLLKLLALGIAAVVLVAGKDTKTAYN